MQISTRRPHWWRGRRGEWYLVIQAALLLLILLAPRSAAPLPSWPPSFYWPTTVLGLALAATGALLALYGVFSLGRNLTPLPSPKDDARLVENGAYRLARHPIYGGIIFMAYGFALFRQGSLTFLLATVLLLFLDLKSRREERFLLEKFPAYDAYRRRVHRLLPFIY